MALLHIDVITLFPGLFEGFLTQTILKRAIERGLVAVSLWNPRDWSEDKHHQVDDRPFGGGPGMVLMPGPFVKAVEEVRNRNPVPGHLIALTPQGRRLDQDHVRELALRSRLILICGRYEGFDERILEVLEPEQLSIGDYILAGGETAAMVVIDSVSRLVPGVLGDELSAIEESFSQTGFIEYPQYTRPRVFRGLTVPEILLGGDHAAIQQWRLEQSRLRSRDRDRRMLMRKSSSVIDENLPVREGGSAVGPAAVP